MDGGDPKMEERSPASSIVAKTMRAIRSSRPYGAHRLLRHEIQQAMCHVIPRGDWQQAASQSTWQHVTRGSSPRAKDAPSRHDV